MDEVKFRISIYPEKEKLKRGQADENEKNLLKDMKPLFPEHLCWESIKDFKDRDEAINDFIPRIKLIERQPNC